MILLYGLVLIAGISTAVQPGMNGQLAKALGGQPFAAGVVSMVMGLVTMLAAGLVFGGMRVPTLQQAAGVPWWAWLGGALGTGVVLGQLFVAQRIGAAPYLGLIVTAGVVTSVALDHFGVAGFAVHTAGVGRLIGGALMIAGVTLVALF